MRDYYIVLGISKGASLEKIKKAYRTVAKKTHPDVSRAVESRERFEEIREAYETLSDETRRRAYDEELARQGSSLRVSRIRHVIHTRRSLWDRLESRFTSSADDFFEGFLPGFFDQGLRRGRGKDLYFEVILSPEEAVRGGLCPVTIPVVEPCPTCNKSGLWEGFFCPNCQGYGRVHGEREFSVSIPPNVNHGTEIRLSLEDIGLRGVDLHLKLFVDSSLP